jgi:hypothetical protein
MGVGFSEYLFSSAIHRAIFAHFRVDANSVSHSVCKNIWQSMELFMYCDVTDLFCCVIFMFAVVLLEVIQHQRMSGSRKTMKTTS